MAAEAGDGEAIRKRLAGDARLALPNYDELPKELPDTDIFWVLNSFRRSE